MNRASVISEDIKQSNKYVIGVPEKDKRQGGAQKFEATMDKGFQNLI